MRAHEQTAPYWYARLAACIGENAKRAEPRHVREDLRGTLREFVDSPVPSEELREILRPYLRGEKK